MLEIKLDLHPRKSEVILNSQETFRNNLENCETWGKVNIAKSRLHGHILLRVFHSTKPDVTSGSWGWGRTESETEPKVPSQWVIYGRNSYKLIHKNMVPGPSFLGFNFLHKMSSTSPAPLTLACLRVSAQLSLSSAYGGKFNKKTGPRCYFNIYLIGLFNI